MQLSLYIERIVRDRIKLVFILVILILPSLEIIQILYNVKMYGAQMPNPNFATFLSCYSIGKVFQAILLWFMPLYLLVIFCEDTLEDKNTGYNNVLLGRTGKYKYIGTKIVGTFIFSFLLIFLALFLNMVLVYIFFKDGQFFKLEGIRLPDNRLFTLSLENPLVTNIIYIFITSFLAALIGTVGTSLSMCISNRKIVYGLTFLLWFMPVHMKNSLIYVIQPYIEYDFNIVIPVMLSLIAGYMIIIIVSVVLEMKYAEI